MRKWPALARSLYLYKFAGPGHDHIHIHNGLRVLLIAEIEDRIFLMADAYADCRQKILDRKHLALLIESRTGLYQCNKGAGD